METEDIKRALARVEVYLTMVNILQVELYTASGQRDRLKVQVILTELSDLLMRVRTLVDTLISQPE